MATLEITDRYPSHLDLIKTFDTDVEILLDVGDDDDQGDSRVLFRSGSRFGHLIFGWASCSGCDALATTDGSIAELTTLRDNMLTSVHWEDAAEDMARYLAEKDWALDRVYALEPTLFYVTRAIEILGEYPRQA
jgi:hypothetical protein